LQKLAKILQILQENFAKTYYFIKKIRTQTSRIVQFFAKNFCKNNNLSQQIK
jgi:hypothetical protein